MTGRRRVGFYVHHEGVGHLTRSLAIAAQLSEPVTVLSSIDPARIESAATSPVDVVHLPPDVGPGSAGRDPSAGGALHWAPLDPDVAAPRARLLVDWLTKADVAALVCDVSVEAAVLARLCGVPPIVVREHGRRTDDAHVLAHRVAHGVLAPFPEALEPAETPAWLRDLSFYSGFVSRPPTPAGRDEARSRLGLDDRPTLVVVVGAGRHSLTDAARRDITDGLRGWQVVVVGASRSGGNGDDGARDEGWVPDISLHLAAADVVAGTAGSNLVAEVAAAGRPFICVPEERPFDEQAQRARRLAELEVAVVRSHWPAAPGWAPAVSQALALGGEGLARLAADASPAIAAEWISRSVRDTGLVAR